MNRSPDHRRVVLCIAALFGLAAGSGSAVADSASPDTSHPIRDIATIRRLPRDAASEGRPVSVEATLVYFTPFNRTMVIAQDEAIWTTPADGYDDHLTFDWRPGDRLVMTGRTGPGHAASVIEFDDVRLLRRGEMPDAPPRSFAEIQSSPLDSQLVATEAIVHDAKWIEDRGHPVLRCVLATRGGNLLYRLAADPADVVHGGDVSKLVDARVRVEGTVGPSFNSRSQMVKTNLLAFDPEGLTILRPAPSDPFAGEPIDLENVLPFSTDRRLPHRRWFRATVTAVIRTPPEGRHAVYVADAMRGMKLLTDASSDALPRPGDRIECAGFIQLDDQYPVMRYPAFRTVGRGPPPVAVPVEPRQILNVRTGKRGQTVEDYEARLVRVRGRLESIERHPDTPFRMYLRCDEKLIPVTLSADRDPTRLRTIDVGSELAVDAICELEFYPTLMTYGGGVPRSFSLLLPDAGAVDVLRAAPWWTTGRLWTLLTWMIIALSITAGIIETLRRRIIQRTMELAEVRRENRELQIHNDATVQERERVALDLHDSLEQSLTGVALQLRATKTAKTPENARRNLRLAEVMLTRSRGDLRRSVWNLWSREDPDDQLRSTVTRIGREIVDGRDVEIVVGGEGEEVSLDGLIAQNLLLLVRECVTNSLKHADPSRITIDIDFRPSDDGTTVAIAVRDDGRGFVVDAAPGSDTGHFGLTGIRERVGRLGGDVTITSDPGVGTAVRLSVRVGGSGAAILSSPTNPTRAETTESADAAR